MEQEYFTKEVCDKINYYVYRLIDPRNGQTFYVGKGKDNRVFAHINGALKDYNGVNYLEEDEDDESSKIKIIRNIKNAGLNVLHVIQRYGMGEKEAFEVESSLIDAYPGLSNLQAGLANDRGVTNSQTIQNKFSVETFTELPNFKYIIIKIKWDRIEYIQEQHPNLSFEDAIYEATRYSWKINKDNAQKYPYVLSVIDGIVKGVYKVKNWELADNGERYEFFKDDTPDNNIVEHFLNKRIPDKYVQKGMANPILYCKED